MFKFIDKIFKKSEQKNLKNLDYLIFGRFWSDNYGTYELFKLTDKEIFVDRSETWHNKRHSQEGYSFEGIALSDKKFEIAKDLINNVPKNILNKNFKGFYTTGNKNENQLIVEIFDGNLKKSITIDSYEIETKDLSVDLKKFRILTENLIKELNK